MESILLGVHLVAIVQLAFWAIRQDKIDQAELDRKSLTSIKLNQSQTKG